ncbi:uncharacterized protein N7496_005438 [Penicillium cataractarum]|uniref:Uncharacterized protein n=1 Tax=Penicillium cataractarum TaxID=2100454 RepID=A0A9W9SHY4_9EURO|nr:uncharacterized protein N7496_005438 [Penicillium cataractarum]KAJ5378029.1 hypothetical protein N7496_005438 [Penicillium cataractarum]
MSTPDARQITNNHTSHEGDAPPLEEYWRIIDSMNPDPEMRAKLRRLLEPPISDYNKDVAAGMIQGMQILQSYAQELPHALPDRKSRIYDHARKIQIVLARILDVAVDGQPVPGRRVVLEIMERNSQRFSAPLYTAIARVCGHPRFNRPSDSQGADV